MQRFYAEGVPSGKTRPPLERSSINYVRQRIRLLSLVSDCFLWCMALFDFDKNFYELRNVLALCFLTFAIFILPALMLAHYGWHHVWQETLLLWLSYILAYTYLYLVCQYVLFTKSLWSNGRRLLVGTLFVVVPAVPIILLLTYIGVYVMQALQLDTPILLHQRLVLNSVVYLTAAITAVMLDLILWYVRAAQEQNRQMYLLQIADREHQIEHLEQQISPHFLFNSLSTLQGLVQADPRQATNFIGDLSDLYRYLLKRVEIVPLGDELAFTRSYLHLMQLRYGDVLIVREEMPQKWLHAELPSVSIQALVENAIKHNAISVQTPLTIDISAHEQDGYRWIVVSNNRNPKLTPVESNGIGLANLNKRYSLRNLPSIRIRQTDEQFVVEIALID